jgi:hypothetical protein
MWSSVPAAMISAFGWMALAETAAYLLPDELVAQFMRAFNWSALAVCSRSRSGSISRATALAFLKRPVTHSTRQLTARRGNLSLQMPITT